MKYLINYFVAVSLMLVAPLGVQAQEVLFQSDFGSDEGLIAIPGDADDSDFEFDYDYADFDGIPEAPNSDLLGGDANRGLKLQANISSESIDSIAVATESLELSGKYMVQVDAWLNYNFPAGASGTTEFGGLSVGHDGGTGNLSGASLLYNTDGDSSLADYRFYKDTTFQAIESGQYAVEGLNADVEPFVTQFPAIDLAEAIPTQQIDGFTPDGTGGFRWMTIEALVDSEALGVGDGEEPGLATFWMTDASSGNKIEIGTIDNSVGDSPAFFTGEVAVVFTDIFTSVSNDPDLSFGLFDNLIVSTVADVSDPLDCSGNGSVGSEDVACATEATIEDTLLAAAVVPGDLDLNGAVEFADFLTFSGNFGDATKAGVYANGDIDLNGAIEFADFLVLSGNFGVSAAGSQSVPEPSGLMLVGLGLVVVASRRRHRG